MEYWVVYDKESGLPLYTGSGSAGVGSFQQLPPNAGLLMVPYEAIASGTVNLDWIRQSLIAAVNDRVGEVRKLFITSVAGQDATYLEKAAEARTWTPEADQSEFPFVNLEAVETEMEVADVVKLVLETAKAWRPPAAIIESKRRGAMVRLKKATNINEMLAASTIDWAAVLSAP